MGVCPRALRPTALLRIWREREGAIGRGSSPAALLLFHKELSLLSSTLDVIATWAFTVAAASIRSRMDRHLQPCVAVVCLSASEDDRDRGPLPSRVYTLKGAEWSESRAQPIGFRANGRSRPSVRRPSIDGRHTCGAAAVANEEMSQQISIIT